MDNALTVRALEIKILYSISVSFRENDCVNRIKIHTFLKNPELNLCLPTKVDHWKIENALEFLEICNFDYVYTVIDSDKQ